MLLTLVSPGLTTLYSLANYNHSNLSFFICQIGRNSIYFIKLYRLTEIMHVVTLTNMAHLPILFVWNIQREEKRVTIVFFGIHAHIISSKLLPLKAVFRVQLDETS